MSTQNTPQQFDPFLEEVENEEGQSLNTFVSKILANWYLFLIGVTLCVFLAVLYSKFASIAYQIDAKIMVKDEKKQSGGMKGLMGDMDMSSLLGGSSDAESELEVLTSRTLMTKVVEKLQLNVTNGIKGKLRALEVEDESVPYTVQFVSKSDTIAPRSYTIDQVTESGFRIKNSKEDVLLTARFGQKIKLPQFTLIINKKPLFDLGKDFQSFGMVYTLNIQSVQSRVAQLLGSLGAETTTKQGPVISLSFKYAVPGKGEQILQTLIDIYMQDNLLDKQKMADSTLKFIDGQLLGVSTGLKGIESQIEAFKTSNDLADMPAQSEELVKNVSSYYTKLNEIDLQLNLIKSISANVNNPKNKQLVPNTLNVTDPVFIQYATTYNQLLLKRQSELLNYTEDNPLIRNLDVQIENARQNLLRGFNAFQDNLQQTRQQLLVENSKLAGEVRKVPKKERVYLDYTRQQNLQQQLYLYLLEKRAETAISRTSTFGNSHIIDGAQSADKPFTPKKQLIYLGGLLAGLVLPFAFLSVREMLNTRVQTKLDITKATGISISGEIGHNPEGESLVIDAKSRSVISEQFRGLRTNLQFLLSGDTSKVIMITSSMSGEGKSFISLNLANALAIAGKKVVLLEFDLRKPKLSINIGIDNQMGFSNYIKSDKITLTDVIQATPLNANVSILPSGPIPPNPAELLMDAKVSDMITALKAQYDYVIVDTAPVGLVADALLLEGHADLTLYIVRQKVTYKSQLKIVDELKKADKIKQVSLVVNDISTKAADYYGYGYGNYGYGYGYGDYAELKQKKKFQIWRR